MMGSNWSCSTKSAHSRSIAANALIFTDARLGGGGGGCCFAASFSFRSGDFGISSSGSSVLFLMIALFFLLSMHVCARVRWEDGRMPRRQ